MNINDIVNKIRNSEDGKVLASNFAYLSILQIVSYLFPLLTLPYLARVIGVDGFGKIAFASAIITWFQTITDWGFGYTATRDVAKNRDDKEVVSEIFSRVFWSRCLLMIFSFILLSILVLFIPVFHDHALVIFVTFLLIPGYIMFPEYFFQALEKMKYITVFNICSKLIFTVCVFLFIKEKEDYIWQPIFISLGFILSGLISMYYILIKWKYKLKRCSYNQIFNTIRGSKDVFISNIIPNVYSTSSILLLGFFHGNVANGIYDAGNRFVNVVDRLMNVIARVFFPYLSRNGSKHSMYAKGSIILSLLVSLCLFILAPFLINIFYTSDFKDAIIVLRILSILIVLGTIDNVYGINFLLVKGYDKQRRIICIICSVFSGILAVFLVYKFSYIGIAFVLLIANGLLGLCSYLYVRKIKKENLHV